jgi:hypothetical protein
MIEGADTSEQPLLARMGAPIMKMVLARLIVRHFDRDALLPYLRSVADERERVRNTQPLGASCRATDCRA